MYNHQEIEKKWQKYWQENNTFKTSNTSLKPKCYCLDMFPYPSGAGLHVGHPEGMTANDIVARYKHAKGYNVLHPMGWDAFGLPAENYAIKTGKKPRITTDENIQTFKRQIQSLGFSYDWEREIDTTDPEYFKWTQWIFLKLFEAGLAYEQDLPINYCPSCKTGLANEEVLGDFSCERCGTQVEKKKIRQWVLAITKYADRLLHDVDDLDWPEGIKDMQRNWIGKSEGCEFELKKAAAHTTPSTQPSPLEEKGQAASNTKNAASLSSKGERIQEGGDCVETDSIRVYTTRVDTVFGMTYAVIAPDHTDVGNFITDEQRADCEAYIKKSGQQSDQDRTADDKEKTGVFTGSYVINPYNNEQVPLWIADYVLGNYGTGAVMAVPAHDERDFEFAKKYDLAIRPVIGEYHVLIGESAPRENFPTRMKKCSTAIVKHPSDDTYLLQQYSNGELCFTGGVIEEGETAQDCMIRELQEESGIQNLGDVSFLGIMVGHGYKDRKKTNCKDSDHIFYIEAKDLVGFLDTATEGLEYKNIWLTEKEILENQKIKSHYRKMFVDFLSGEKAMTGYGILMNSGDFDGLTSEEAKDKFTELAEEGGFGHKKTNYKLRDWLFSRQRYWGEPIPLIHLERDDVRALPRITSLEDEMETGKAYVLKSVATDQSDERILCSKGQEKSLVIDGKIVSKIYSGIYNDIICDYELPLKLPEVDAYEPSGDGTSPLTKVESFVNVELAGNLKGKRETNTMPQWGGSCWYYLRFMDTKNPDDLVGSEVEKYWGQVDSYVGGAEHAVLHLLYARFWHKFLFDIGVVSTSEPFHRLRNQGMILGMSYRNSAGRLIANDMMEEKDGKYFDIETGEELEKIPAKMSKSLKNVINPDDIVKEYGADTLRMYEMYMADFKDAAPWDTSSIVGVKRFLDKFYGMMSGENPRLAKSDDDAMKTLHKAIKKIEQDIENYKFNTAIAQMMILLNTGEPQDEQKNKEWKQAFIQLLHPFAPHMAEECWEMFAPEKESYQKVYFATGNKQKIERAQKLFSRIDSSVTLTGYQELIEVQETGDTPMECALQKLEVYKGKNIDAPIMTLDTAVYFDGQETSPTHVKRAALSAIGKTESECSQEEVAQTMLEYYKDIAKQAGGKKDFYYRDAIAVLFPDGTIQTAEYRREYVLHSQEHSELQLYFPMRSLFTSKITGKGDHNATQEDFFTELACQSEALIELFGYQGNSIFFTDWPKYDEAMTIDSEITIGVQVLGKLRGEIKISKDEDKSSVLEKAKSQESVAKWLEGKTLVKEIYVPGKIVNLVVK